MKRRSAIWVGTGVLLVSLGTGWSLYSSLKWEISRVASRHGLEQREPELFNGSWSRFGPKAEVVVYYRSDGLTLDQKLQFVDDVEAVMRRRGFIDLDTANGKLHEYARNRVWSHPGRQRNPGVRLQCGMVEASIAVEDAADASLLDPVMAWFSRLTGRP